MISVKGNSILGLLAASTMRDKSVNGEALGTLFLTYDYNSAMMCRAIYTFIRECGVTKVSKATLKLADIAIKHFTEEEIKMEDYKKLYVSCPNCGGLMYYYDEDHFESTIDYRCQSCEVTFSIHKNNVDLYLPADEYARAVYGNISDSEEEEYRSLDGVERYDEDEDF